MNTVNDVTLEVIEVVKEVLKLSRNIDMNEDLVALGLDSMDSVMLTIALEDRFNIEVSDEEQVIDNISTVEKIVNFVMNKLNNDLVQQ